MSKLLNYFFLLIAVISLILLLPITFIYRTIAGSFTSNFARNLAINIDYVGGTLIFNSNGHTISAMCIEKRKYTAAKLINFLFRNDLHCQNAWKHEFIDRYKNIK